MLSPRPGFSTLMTSAPMSPSSEVHHGPAAWWLMSITRIPARAAARAGEDIRFRVARRAGLGQTRFASSFSCDHARPTLIDDDHVARALLDVPRPHESGAHGARLGGHGDRARHPARPVHGPGGLGSLADPGNPDDRHASGVRTCAHGGGD